MKPVVFEVPVPRGHAQKFDNVREGAAYQFPALKLPGHGRFLSLDTLGPEFTKGERIIEIGNDSAQVRHFARLAVANCQIIERFEGRIWRSPKGEITLDNARTIKPDITFTFECRLPVSKKVCAKVLALMPQSNDGHANQVPASTLAIKINGSSGAVTAVELPQGHRRANRWFEPGWKLTASEGPTSAEPEGISMQDPSLVKILGVRKLGWLLVRKDRIRKLAPRELITNRQDLDRS